MEVARKNPDPINNVVLINSPVRGIEGTVTRRAETLALKQVLKPFLGDEKVTDYLFDIWGNKKYQKELEGFASTFTKSGKGLVVIVSEDDPIVPKESSIVKGVDVISISVGSVPVAKYLEAHGRPLKNERVLKAIAERIGENLAA